jgi:hypothetical protein
VEANNPVPQIDSTLRNVKKHLVLAEDCLARSKKLRIISLGIGPEAHSCEIGNEPSGFTEAGHFISSSATFDVSIKNVHDVVTQLLSQTSKVASFCTKCHQAVLESSVLRSSYESFISRLVFVCVPSTRLPTQ